MRFFTFLQDYWTTVDQRDEEVITFAGWIYTDGLPKKNPHAGLAQVELYINQHKTSDIVKTGFFKAKEAYLKVIDNNK